MFTIIPPHRNLGCLALVSQASRYLLDLSLPHREGWGWSWGRLVRLYWRGPDNRRHWFYLPSFAHNSDPDEKEII